MIVLCKEIKLPHYEEVIVKCVHEMRIKFKNYGNDWLTSDDLYWKERLTKEIKEYCESMTIDSEKRKLLNIINIAMMAYETAETNRGCRQHMADFEDIVSSKGSDVFVNCTVCSMPLVIYNGIILESK